MFGFFGVEVAVVVGVQGIVSGPQGNAPSLNADAMVWQGISQSAEPKFHLTTFNLTS